MLHVSEFPSVVTDSTCILLDPMEITCLLVGTGSLSSGSSIVCTSHPETSMNLNTRATYPPSFRCGVSLLRGDITSFNCEPGKRLYQRWPWRSQINWGSNSPLLFHIASYLLSARIAPWSRSDDYFCAESCSIHRKFCPSSLNGNWDSLTTQCQQLGLD